MKKDCQKCQGKGVVFARYFWAEVYCLNCAGRGSFNLNELRRYRIGQQISRCRQRYNIRLSRVWKLFHISSNDWRKIETGHYPQDYLLSILSLLKRYTDTLERVPIYTLLQNPKNRKSTHEEIITTYNKELVLKIKAELESKTVTFQIVEQSEFVQRLSPDSEL